MYNNAVIHNGDNQTGGTDAECITFDLKSIPSDIDHIILSLDLLKEKKKIGFGRIQEAYLRLYYKDTGEEITEADFGHLNGGTKIVVAGRLNREDDGWSFAPDGTAYPDNSLESFLKNYVC